MKLQGPVLVGTDLSAASDEALRQGSELAKGLGTNLIVCHIVTDLDTVNVLFPQFADRNAEHRQTVIDTALAAVKRQISTRLGDRVPNIMAVVDSGTPHAGVLGVADTTGAGLIVLGPGRTADRVVRHATVPALIARHSPRGLVVGTTDFSDPSLPALEIAASEAQRRGSPLQVLHIVDIGIFAIAGVGGGALPLLPGAPGMSLPAIDELVIAAQGQLRDALARFAIHGEAVVKVGPAASTIVDHTASPPAELVVVGTHGRTGLSRLTLGSTAEAVIRSAPCSVLVVRLST